MLFIHFSDNHLGDHFPVKPPKDYTAFRGFDFLSNYFRVVNYILQNIKDIDFILHTGDLFENETPPLYILQMALKPLKYIDGKGIRIFVVPGNHERSLLLNEVASTFKNIVVFNEPGTFRFEVKGKTVSITGIPYINSKKSNIDPVFEESLKSAGFTERADFNILMMHQLVHKAKVGPTNFAFRKFPDVVSHLPEFKAFDYIAAGHIHKYQKMGRFHFPGSSERVTFSEINEPKGFLRVQVGDRSSFKTDFIELPARDMFEFRIQLFENEPEKNEREVKRILSLIKPQSYGKIRFEGVLTKEELEKLDLNALKQKAFKCHFNFKDLRLKSTEGHIFLFKSTDLKGDSGTIVDLKVKPEKLNALPKKPGLLVFKNKEKRVLFLTKTENVKKMLLEMLKKVDKYPFIKTLVEKTCDIEYSICEDSVQNMINEFNRYRSEKALFRKVNHLPRDYFFLKAIGRNSIRTAVLCEHPCGGEGAFLGPFSATPLKAEAMDYLLKKMGFPFCIEHPIEDSLFCTHYLKTECLAPCKEANRRSFEAFFKGFWEDPVNAIKEFIFNFNGSNPGKEKFIAAYEEMITEIEDGIKSKGLTGYALFKNGKGILNSLLFDKGRLIRVDILSGNEPKPDTESYRRAFKNIRSQSNDHFNDHENRDIVLKAIEQKKMEFFPLS